MSSLEPRPGHVVAMDVIPTCDICQRKPAVFDARTAHGSSWAYMCTPCAQEHAAQPLVTGVGIGQRLVEREVGA